MGLQGLQPVCIRHKTSNDAAVAAATAAATAVAAAATSELAHGDGWGSSMDAVQKIRSEVSVVCVCVGYVRVIVCVCLGEL